MVGVFTFIGKNEIFVEFDKMVERQILKQKVSEGYVHWHKRAYKSFWKWGRESFAAIPMDGEQYLFNINGIFKYLKAACHAAELHNEEVVNNILLELSSHRGKIEYTKYYDVFHSDSYKNTGFYWSSLEPYFLNLSCFEGIEYISFLKDWDRDTLRDVVDLPKEPPIKPIRKKGESQEYYRYRMEKFCDEIYKYLRFKNSPRPSAPQKEPEESTVSYIKRQFQFSSQLKAWEKAQSYKEDIDTSKIRCEVREKYRDWFDLLDLIAD